MSDIILAHDEYRDKVYACWLGKNIGGTLGGPHEGKKYTHDLTFYDPVPDKSAPNDDLDLQLVWLAMLENEGIPPRLATFAEYWSKYLHRYPWNEYGFCNRNLTRGLTPPISGWFENYYVDEMGSPIRSELWACVAPADPQTAAALAWKDAAMDHAGGEGTWGEMFWAAVESAAFVLSDAEELIRIGLDMIPPACSIARAVREVVWCRRNGIRYDDARQRLTRTFWNDQPCNAIPNAAFTVIGWLYGTDFGDRLCKAVNCGFDTDCTGATLGALLGILNGTRGVPSEWREPVGTDIVLHHFTVDCGLPKTLDELTARTCALAEAAVEQMGLPVGFGDSPHRPADLLTALHRNEKALEAAGRDVRCGTAVDGDLEIFLHYNGEPVLYPGVGRRIEVTCRRNDRPAPATVQLRAPAGWQVQALGEGRPTAFEVVAPEMNEAAQLQVSVDAKGYTAHMAFTVLSPRQAQGYPSAVQSTQWRPGMQVRTRWDGGLNFVQPPKQ